MRQGDLPAELLYEHFVEYPVVEDAMQNLVAFGGAGPRPVSLRKCMYSNRAAQKKDANSASRSLSNSTNSAMSPGSMAVTAAAARDFGVNRKECGQLLQDEEGLARSRAPSANTRKRGSGNPVPGRFAATRERLQDLSQDRLAGTGAAAGVRRAGRRRDFLAKSILTRGWATRRDAFQKRYEWGAQGINGGQPYVENWPHRTMRRTPPTS